MALDPLQERYLQRFFDGLISAVQALGSGEFTEKRPVLGPKGKGIHSIRLHLQYKMADGALAIVISSSLRKGEPPYVPAGPNDLTPVELAKWNRHHYSLDYSNQNGETFFRFDLDEISSHHVHMQPDTKAHTPSSAVTPNVVNMDPREFVRIVAKFRSDRVYPVKMKK